MIKIFNKEYIKIIFRIYFITLLLASCNYLFADYSNLKEAVTDTVAIKEYSLIKNETITRNLENLGGTQLTIFGNGYEVNGNLKLGINILREQTLNIENTTWNNFNNLNGGVLNNSGILNIYKSTFTNNEGNSNTNSVSNGGAIYNAADATILANGNLVFNNNIVKTSSGSVYGGAIYNDGRIYVTENIVFDTNKIFSDYKRCYGQGGAVFNRGELVITGNAIFTNNTAQISNGGYTGGGAIYNYYGTINFNNVSKFNGNKVEFENNIYSSSGPDGGGAISNCYGIINLKQGLFYNNSVNSDKFFFARGGAIYNELNSVMTIGNDSEFVNNKAVSVNDAGRGGAIYNAGIIIIGSNVIFSSNSAIHVEKMDFPHSSAYNWADGGAIFNIGNITIGENAFFEENNAVRLGGAIYAERGSTTTFVDGVKFINNKASSSGAIYTLGILNLIANTNNIEFTGNIANGVSNAITTNGGIINLWASENANIVFNDRIIGFGTTTLGSPIININASTTTLDAIGKIILNEDMTGYIGDVNLYRGTIELGTKGTLFGGNMTVDNATIDIANKIIQYHNFNTLTINRNLVLVLDADLVNKQMDTITANEDSNIIKKSINVKAINILTDNKENETTKILFTSSPVLKDKITSTTTVNSRLYKYKIVYDNGYFNFINIGINTRKQIFENQIATSVGGFITQVTVLNQSFASLDKKRKSMLFKNPNRIEGGLWLRPFITQETVTFNGFDVDNSLTGTLAGLDLATGQDSLLSIYLGYAGSQQKYENIKVSQTGYILGVTGMLVKEQWYAGLTANINFNKAESQSSYGTDNFDMNMYSVGAKAGYNFDLSDKWVLEPNLILMYGNVNNQEYQTTQGAKVEGQSIANIIFEPQIKAKLNLENGWQPYGLIGYVVNAGDKVTTKVEEVEFDGQKIGNYVEFGAGVDKSFKNSPWSLYIQLTGRSGDRTGFDGNFGIKYSFLTAKEKKKISKIKKIQAKRKAKEEFLREKKKAELKEQQEIEEENKRIQQEEQEEQRRLEIQRRIKANYEE